MFPLWIFENPVYFRTASKLYFYVSNCPQIKKVALQNVYKIEFFFLIHMRQSFFIFSRISPSPTHQKIIKWMVWTVTLKEYDLNNQLHQKKFCYSISCMYVFLGLVNCNAIFRFCFICANVTCKDLLNHLFWLLPCVCQVLLDHANLTSMCAP